MSGLEAYKEDKTSVTLHFLFTDGDVVNGASSEFRPPGETEGHWRAQCRTGRVVHSTSDGYVTTMNGEPQTHRKHTDAVEHPGVGSVPTRTSTTPSLYGTLRPTGVIHSTSGGDLLSAGLRTYVRLSTCRRQTALVVPPSSWAPFRTVPPAPSPHVVG